MGGVKVDPSKQLAQRTQALSDELMSFYRQDRARGFELIEPFIRQQKMLISEEPGAVMSALAPVIAPLEKSYTAARGSIMEATEPGAARQLALSNLERERAFNIGQARASITQPAYQTLASIGSNLASFGLQEAGGALGASDITRAALNDIMQAQAARKASTMSFLGDLARTAGSLGMAKMIK